MTLGPLPPVLGHRASIARLWSALERDALHHAILLEGPRGVGKRLIANRLAMAANCTHEAVGERPCGVCATCRQIRQGLHPDVIALEPDLTKAARTIPVDAVREVIRQAQYHRYGARRRFILVDPAEAMQEPAANALLKTLEEPPPGTGFVVITHNPKALLPTILSRCQRVRLGAVPEAEVRGWLEREGRPHAAQAARLGQGCPGQAMALTESLETRLELRNGVLAVLRAGLADVYAYTTKLTSGGRQAWAARVEQVLEVVEELLRDAAVLATESQVQLLHEDLREELVDWSAQLWPEGLARCTEALQACRDDLEVYVSGRTALDALICANPARARAA